MARFNLKVNWDSASGSEHYRWTLENGSDIVTGPGRDPDEGARYIDPEEAFIASLSSCHLLTFLAIAAKAGFQVVRYEDEPVGVLEKNPEGRIAMTRVLLQPTVVFGENKPTIDDLKQLHEKASRNCFIANSVKTAITIEPRVP